jgi:type IV secretory pathway TraG/TraD family ATPase VirD4
LGTLLVSKLNQLALSRQEQRESERRNFYLYIDEFQNFITPSMTSILSGARKYRLGLILAHQDLRQLSSEDSQVASSVLSKPYTRMCFRLGDQDARKLAEGFSFFDTKDLQNLGTGEAICRIERADYDFNLKTSPLPKVDEVLAEERREQLISLSRQRYATPRADVEELLNRQWRRPEAEPLSTEEETKREETAERYT